MSGTNKRNKFIAEGPAIILANPQLGENIGAAARAMANFGLAELRLVSPRDGWPSKSAKANAANADYILEQAKLYPTLEKALFDINFAYATTARQREMLKPVHSPKMAAKKIRSFYKQNIKTAIIFGKERTGLKSSEIALADEIITFPVNPAYASLNLAQAVLLLSYEWFITENESLPVVEPNSGTATKQDLFYLFNHLETALEKKNYFYPIEKKATMIENLRCILQKAKLSKQEIHALRGVVAAFEGKKSNS